MLTLHLQFFFCKSPRLCRLFAFFRECGGREQVHIYIFMKESEGKFGCILNLVEKKIVLRHTGKQEIISSQARSRIRAHTLENNISMRNAEVSIAFTFFS